MDYDMVISVVLFENQKLAQTSAGFADPVNRLPE